MGDYDSRWLYPWDDPFEYWIAHERIQRKRRRRAAVQAVAIGVAVAAQIAALMIRMTR